MDAIDGALTMVRALWPQTANWPPGTWAAWGAMLDDLDPDTLAPAIREVASTNEWPSLAAIRAAALRAELAPPVVVALSDQSHPAAREAARTSWIGDGELDTGRFERTYRELAKEWNRCRLGGQVMHLPGNAAADHRAAVWAAIGDLKAGEPAAQVLGALEPAVLADVERTVRSYGFWNDEGDFRGENWCRGVFEFFAGKELPA